MAHLRPGSPTDASPDDGAARGPMCASAARPKVKRVGMQRTGRATRWAMLGLVVGGAVVTQGTASVAGPTATNASAQRLHGGAFFSNCRFSHASNDDPIVLPRRPGRSHAHTFFGNVSTNASSTLASLRRAGTTCSIPADKAAYWIPTLYEGGRAVKPAKGQFYYVMRGYDEMRPFPAGLRVIAGDAGARRPQSVRTAYWACGGGGGVRSGPARSIPTCGVVTTGFTVVVKRCRSCAPERTRRKVSKQTFLELHVTFPDCWDGVHLDSRDHKSHMAYSRAYVCPASHPVKVPLIQLNVQYPTTGGDDVELASGGEFSGHADFFNAWEQRALTRLVNECFRDRCNDALTQARAR
jgi:hypothetical protein